MLTTATNTLGTLSYNLYDSKYRIIRSYTTNQLESVIDASNSSAGFNDGDKIGIDYTYDIFGNLKTDKNKNITNITYNHLNLPYQVSFNNDGIDTRNGNIRSNLNITETKPKSDASSEEETVTKVEREIIKIQLKTYMYDHSTKQSIPGNEYYQEIYKDQEAHFRVLVKQDSMNVVERVF